MRADISEYSKHCGCSMCCEIRSWVIRTGKGIAASQAARTVKPNDAKHRRPFAPSPASAHPSLPLRPSQRR